MGLRLAKKVRALVLFSGGLDSMLAVKILQEQGIEVTGLVFRSCFFNEDKAIMSAKQLKIPIVVKDISPEHLKMVKKPPHGYGKAVNPCLDCHALMLKKTLLFNSHTSGVRNRLENGQNPEKYDFVATGEVLGERPFSQNYQALLKIQEISGLGDRLLRPLSARLLPITLPEQKGWVKRDKLGDIQGRGRHKQLSLAKKFKIKSFPQPAGGCILCERIFGQKLFELFKKWPDCTPDDIALLSAGRHFWEENCLIVIGRNQAENEQLERLAKVTDILVVPKNFSGPSGLARKISNRSKIVKTIQSIILKYTKKSKLNTKRLFDIK